MTTPSALGITPNFCGEDQITENFEKIVEQLTHALPKLSCAQENWRMVSLNAELVHPSHRSYPPCPTIEQLCYVMVKPVLATDPDVKVHLPCPRNRDPNIESGDAVLYHEDSEGNAFYQGTHDDPIGTVKWWHGRPEEVPAGWYWITDNAPTRKTRTGRYAKGFGKYPKNYFSREALGLDVDLGSLGMDCPGNDLTLIIDPHDASGIDVDVADHPLTETSTEFTDITIDCSGSYVGEECLDGMYGYVDIADHSHLVDLQEITLGGNGMGSTPFTVAAKEDVCTGPALNPGCGSPLTDYNAIDMYETCHDHYLYLGCEIDDPGHFHAFELPPHEVTVSGVLPHSFSIEQMSLPRVYFLLIERLNNAANAPSNVTYAGQHCIPDTEP